MDDLPKSRMRLRFARLAAGAGMSHLEQIKALRTMAAASGLDCFYAGQGRKAVPKMAFGPALSAGCESGCEYADLYLAQVCRESVVRDKISAACQAPFSLLSVKRVPVLFPSIEASAGAARYLIETETRPCVPQAALDGFFSRESSLLERSGAEGEKQTLDARPLVLAAALDAASGSLRVTLKLEPGKNLKPAEVLRLLAGTEVSVKRLVREELFWIDSKGKLEII